MGFVALATGAEAEPMVKTMVSALAHRPGASAASLRLFATPSGDWWVAGSPAGLTDGGLRRIVEPGLGRPPTALFCDGSPPDSFALAAFAEEVGPVLARGPLGLRPLYYLERRGRPVAFASEFKAFGALSGDIRVFPPGHIWVGGAFRPFSLIHDWPCGPVAARDLEVAAREVRQIIEQAVERGCRAPRPGGTAPEPGAAPVAIFLSGGIDSSAVAAAAAARLGAGNLRSFCVGTPVSEDLPKARQVARHLGLSHTEGVFEASDVIRILPEVIYHLESCDPPLVRSSVANYLVAQMAAEAGCGQALCGEGGDELFAGYAYLKSLGREAVPAELIALLEGGHGNGFQRVDRMTSAHGLEARVPLAALDLLAYALRIPIEWKIGPETGQEKLVLRRAFAGALPTAILQRPKAKFYEGSGAGEVMAEVAERLVTDADFERQRGRALAPGRVIDTKEQLLYLRLFRERFDKPSALDTVSWTRTLGAAARS